MLTSNEQQATVRHSPLPPPAFDPVSYGRDPAVLADIYEDEINLAVWQRSLSAGLLADVESLIVAEHRIATSMTVSPETVQGSVSTALAIDRHSPLCEDLAGLVDMFCCLFERERVGLRLTELDSAMCPRFHVDNVACRMITTYVGVATEWLPNTIVDRSRLGQGNHGRADHQSGLYQQEDAIQRLSTGDVALLKGEGWDGNEGRGLVHRSPSVPAGARRLVLTLDIL